MLDVYAELPDDGDDPRDERGREQERHDGDGREPWAAARLSCVTTHGQNSSRY